MSASEGASTLLSDEHLFEWLAGLKYEEIPASTAAVAKLAILDTLAVGWAGTQADGVHEVLGYVCSTGAGPCRLWGHDIRLSATAAALGNGLLSAALDFDVIHDGFTAHSHIVMLPALMALGEELGVSGRDFLAAYIGACEISVRLGRGVRHNPGWLGSSVFGVIAAAAGCARLLRLSPGGVRAAAGMALSRAAGTQQPLIEGNSSKRLQTAFAARDAIECARLVQAGVTAPLQLFTGRAGFQALYLNLSSEPERRLGLDWHSSKVTLKKFPSCFCNHAAIVAAQRASGGPLSVGLIRACRVRIPPFSAKLVGGPFEPHRSPQVAAQFSVRYSVASSILRGSVTLDDLATRAVLDPVVVEFAQRIEVQIDPAVQDDYVPATVEIEYLDGSTNIAQVDVIPGTPAAPADEREWMCKAEACFGSGPAPLLGKRFARTAERVKRLEQIEDLSAFW